ncbi:ATP-binding cassette sub-family C member 5-like isoform X5 [Schistocerca gregaria]|uniref:ATP-binding cassette sub-family C member 5-like isoform X5 n=1 Tax=Schistocerca gregaria TaxID=7010 RepID=UPI00211E2BC7|nr:ATP-binding cassette sub-family C member 5-like isoform X5 [Schistocerca gregaria]XP_049827811.1 ATP-binding cassette sub-family C member 5-like isoform X5 [Schistocerca gregaria]
MANSGDFRKIPLNEVSRVPEIQPNHLSDSQDKRSDGNEEELLKGRRNSSLQRSPYRAYVNTTPQYMTNHGMSRYQPALKNLIPVRRNIKNKKVLGIDSAGLFSYIYYSWVSPYMYHAHKKGFTLEDLPQGSHLESCDLNSQRLQLIWQDEVARVGLNDASLSRVVRKFIQTRMIVSCMLYAASLVMGFVSPTIFMRNLLQYAEGSEESVWNGIKWAAFLTLAEFLRILLFSWHWAVSYRTGIRLRAACLALLYRKLFRLNNLGDSSTGQLINIFSNDGQKIMDMALFVPMIIGGPIVIICGVSYILWLLGPWAVLGMTSFLLFYPLQYAISRMTAYFRGRAVKITDKRVKLMTEILNSIKFIKMYAWEKGFCDSLLEIRKTEHQLLEKSAYCQSLSISIAPTVPVISAIVTFLAHLAAGNNLTASQKLLVLEDMMSYITRPVDKTQALCINNGSFAMDGPVVSDVDNKPRYTTSDTCANAGDNSDATETEKLKSYIATSEKNENIISDINLLVSKGQLIGICGPVGSGKTSLLLAALGQMRITSGHVFRDGSCAYVSQEAWIQNATLKENVLFGETFEAKRYYEAVYSCALVEDIKQLPGADETEIGERGINLSGGQKQRVALARALYSNRDIYFLDDPLSAVDAHVGAHIFEKCILTALKDKTVLLVTHQVQFLSRCDKIYVLKDGRILEEGTHEELMASEKEYSIMIKRYTASKDQENNVSLKEPVEAGLNDVSYFNSDMSGMDMRGEHHTPGNIQGQKIMEKEEITKGNIRFYTYQSYISAAGGYFITLIVSLCFLLNVGSTAFSTWWLALWIKEGSGNVTINLGNVTVISHNLNDNPKYHMYQLVYAVTIAVILGTSLLRGFMFTKVSLRASTILHNKLFKKVVESPLYFFETTPLGRMQTLFSRDIDEVDVRLPITVETIMQNILLVVFAILFICVVFPWFFVAVIVLGVVYHLISKIFRSAIRDIKRLDAVTRSPVLSAIGSTVSGLSTIHAFAKEGIFISKFVQLFDENSTCSFLSMVSMRWLAVRIDSLAVVAVCLTSCFVIAFRDVIPPALSGLALSYSAHISGIFQYTVRLVSETEMRFISVERINSYLRKLMPEDFKTAKINVLPEWPTKGRIEFKNVSLCYREGLPNVLKGINFIIESAEKIGIVGRTGSGKSSLVAAIYRMAELSSGKITVDGVNIADVKLQHLRSRLSVIPQDPVLFSGTIRSNLDLNCQYTDAEIWLALERTKLRDKVLSMKGQLDATVSQEGDSLSTGEKQLLCLARALLRNCKILILDEATAAVDPETEACVQSTIESEFQHCTVLTIAHRLNTVIHCDRIIVMDKGQVVEMDAPRNLLSNPDSVFNMMCSASDA